MKKDDRKYCEHPVWHRGLIAHGQFLYWWCYLCLGVKRYGKFNHWRIDGKLNIEK